jgi:guanylate kinase
MERVTKKIVLVGKSSAGKTELAKIFESLGLRREVSYTSRARRNGEEPGVDYWFITKEEFEERMELGQFIECVNFNGWWYGTLREEYDKSEVFVFTPTGLGHVLNHVKREELYVIYMDADDETRRNRCLARGDDPAEVERRIGSDARDFADFKNYDYHVLIKPESTLGDLRFFALEMLQMVCPE